MEQYVFVDQCVFAQAQQFLLTDQYFIAGDEHYVSLVNQYVIQVRQQYALIALICDEVQ